MLTYDAIWIGIAIVMHAFIRNGGWTGWRPKLPTI